MSENIQVVVRCRGRNQHEVAAKLPAVVSVPAGDPVSDPTVTVNPQAGPMDHHTQKTFRVDQVYGPHADQKLVFENVALPLFADFVAGLDVTIMAYGQTGSGKTHTMCGDVAGDNAGIIPRVLARLFDTLAPDYAVKVSCMELYNEELRDLVNDAWDVQPVRLKLRLVPAKGLQATLVQNLAEVHIDSAEMGFRVLQLCLGRRRTSATKLNDRLLRSHTIFTVLLYKAVPLPALPGLLAAYRVSKMNLVDLAGSEDIHKLGAVNERAREAGSINQSLLALGKVICALSNGSEPRHVPYRESKLTRLLQGAIGGKTKTALIATISPALVNMHETVSTLTYAARAKNIRNLPQSSTDAELVLKRVLVADLSASVARLTRDLVASKDKDDGVKMSLANYNQYALNVAELETSLREKDEQLQALQAKVSGLRDDLDRSEAAHADTRLQLQEQAAATQTHIETTAKLASQIAALEKKDADRAAQTARLQKALRDRQAQVAQLVRHNVLDVRQVIGHAASAVVAGNTAVLADIEAGQAAVLAQFRAIFAAAKDRALAVCRMLDADLAREITDFIRSQALPPSLQSLQNFSLDRHISELKAIQGRAASQLAVETDHDLLLRVRASAEQDFEQKREAVARQIAELLQGLSASQKTVLDTAVSSVSSKIHESMQQQVQSVMGQAAQDSGVVYETIQSEALAVPRAVATAEATLSEQKDTTGQKIHHAITRLADTVSSEPIDFHQEEAAVQQQLTSIRGAIEKNTGELGQHLRNVGAEFSKLEEQAQLMRPPPDLQEPSPKRRQPMTLVGSPNLQNSRIPRLHPAKQS